MTIEQEKDEQRPPVVPVITTTTTTTKSALSLSAEGQFSFLPYGSTVDMTALANIKALEKLDDDKSRVPLDVMVVLDQSGSMSTGGKLELCKETLIFLLGELNSSDRFGLVTYDSNVHNIFPMSNMDAISKDMAKIKIQKVRCGSMTNLSGGLFAGIDQLNAATKRGSEDEVKKSRKQAILLLTDGLLNEGVRDSQVLVKMMKSFLDEGNPGTSVFTFGYGSGSTDAECLKMIAEHANGVFYNVENTEDVPTAFSECLGGLLSVVAQNITITVEAMPGTSFSCAPMTKYACVPVESGHKYKVTLPDMYSGEERDILFKIKVETGLSKDPKPDVLHFSMQYADCVTQGLSETNVSLDIVRKEQSISNGDYKADVNKQVLRQMNRLLAVRGIEEAFKDAEANDFKAAKARLGKCRTDMYEYKNREDDGMFQELISDLEESATQLSSRARYMGGGRSHMAKASMVHSYQRCSDTTAEKNSCYSNSIKMQMKKKAMKNIGVFSVPTRSSTADQKTKVKKKVLSKTQTSSWRSMLPSYLGGNSNSIPDDNSNQNSNAESNKTLEPPTLILGKKSLSIVKEEPKVSS